MKPRHFNCLVLCLLLFLGTGCISDREWRYAMEPHTAVIKCTIRYYADHQHWPTSREELAEWSAKHRVKFPNERYASVSFQEQKDGSVLIHYETSDKGGGMGTVQLGPASAETR
jgi:hypothetical protein